MQRDYKDRPRYNSDEKPVRAERNYKRVNHDSNYEGKPKRVYSERRNSDSSYSERRNSSENRAPRKREHLKKTDVQRERYNKVDTSVRREHSGQEEYSGQREYGKRSYNGNSQSRGNQQRGNQRSNYQQRGNQQRGNQQRGFSKPNQKKQTNKQKNVNFPFKESPYIRRDELQRSKAVEAAFAQRPTSDPNTVRLNKFIANSGVCSRREADDLILAGVVTVNGVVVTELGTKVSLNDDIRFNGERLKGENKVYLVMNKPKGYVTTTNDPHADKMVMELINPDLCPQRVFPVGRLDKDTTGVLLFTNDGDIAEKLSHPSYQKKKIYQVQLNKNLSKEKFERLLTGVELEDGPIYADALAYLDGKMNMVGVEIHSGRNRVVRRMFQEVGLTVVKLDRVYFAGLTKKGLRRGAWRFLTEQEVTMLRVGSYN